MALETVTNFGDLTDSVNNFLNNRGRVSTNRAADIRVLRSLLTILRNTPASSPAPKNVWSTVMHGAVDSLLVELSGGAAATSAERTSLLSLVNELRADGLDPQSTALANLLGGSSPSTPISVLYMAIAFIGRRNNLNNKIEDIFTRISNEGDFSHIRFFIVDEEQSSRVELNSFNLIMTRFSFPSMSFLELQNPVAGPYVLRGYPLGVGPLIDRTMRYNEITEDSVRRYLRANMKRR